MWRLSFCTHNCACLGPIPACDGKHDSDFTGEGVLKMILRELESGIDHDLRFLEPQQAGASELKLIFCGFYVMNVHHRLLWGSGSNTVLEDRGPEWVLLFHWLVVRPRASHVIPLDLREEAG